MVKDQRKRKELTSSMNNTEALEIIRTISDMYPNAYKDIDNQTKADRQKELMVRHLSDFEYTDVINGLHTYFDSEKGRYIPSMRDLKDFAKMEKRRRLSRQGISRRRIETAEEVIANEYVELMELARKNGLSEEIRAELEKRKKYYLMFYGPNKDKNYEEYFGMSREEFERLD